MNLSIARLSPIGLDLGTRAIKAAQVIRNRSGFRLAAAVSLARLDPAPALSGREAERLGPALVRAGFRGRLLAAAIPAEMAVHTSADLPARAARAPLDEIAASELSRVSRLAPDDLVCAHWPTSDSDRSELVPARVVGAERKAVEALLDSLAQVSPDGRRAVPVALDTGPWALVRCLAPWLGETRDVAVIVDIGWRRCGLTIVQGQRIVYERLAAGVGQEALQDAICKELGAPPDVVDHLLRRVTGGAAPEAGAEIAGRAIVRQAEQLAQEVERSLRFAAEGGADGDYRVILAGGGASAAMADALRGPLEGLAEVRCAAPGELVGGASAEAARNPALIGAIGLAMRMDQ